MERTPNEICQPRTVEPSHQATMSPASDLPPSNPGYLKLAYISFFLVQSLDTFLFLTLSPQLFKTASILTGPTQFFIRSNAVTLFPFCLLVFRLRKHPITTPVGRIVAQSFVLFHGAVLVFVGWCVVSGRWYLEPLYGVLGFHGFWFVSGSAALAGV
jgi:hypothetical protein